MEGVDKGTVQPEDQTAQESIDVDAQLEALGCK
jgi:hypothetical protein